ncbi:TadE family protein [Sulfitobacter sp. HNIBRBA3233]|uniref:TadE/TadG family type IV pilus assembly protein n=1 Tax=Sulfitobacter marinivivus TaxID=3158558 RepID=UPI0032DE8108
MTRLKKRLRIFRKNEDGMIIALEFVIMAPLIFSFFFFGLEMGIYSVRQMLLDRGLEVTTRQVRLNTGMVFDHDDLKRAICQNAGNLPDCNTVLRLEMVSMDPRNFTGLPASPDCPDVSEPATPVRGWSLGQPHELMILRACYKFTPVFPMTGLGQDFRKDGGGKVAMTSISAFVQEPR